jgi:ABC-type transport system substrate-binding protein
MYGLSLNTRMEPFKDVDVRRALAFAVDRYLIQRAWNQAATITCQFLPPDYSAYRPYCPYTRPTPGIGGWRAPDEPTAWRLVQRSHTRGMSVTVTVWDTSMVAEFSYVIDALNDLGYDARLDVYDGDPGAYFDWVSNSRHKVQAAFFGWINGDATAASALDLWRCSAYRRGASTINPAGFCDRRFDRLLDQARRVESTSLAKATQLWAKADRMLTDKAPWIPLVTPTWVDVVSTRVRNYARSPVLGMLFDQMRLR